MNTNDIGMLYAYNRWAWDRVLAETAQLTAEQYVALAPVPHGSVRGTLVHALAAEVIWRRRCQGESPTELINEVDLPAFAGLQARWKVEAQALQTLIASLTDDALASTLEYKNTRGTPFAEVLWRLLAHLVNHGTQHRSEAAMLLTTFGFSPGDLDLITYLREAG